MSSTSSVSIHNSLALFLFLVFTPSLAHGNNYDPFTSTPEITHHGGPILTGKLNLALIWYGNCGRIQKNLIRNFIKSLNNNNNDSKNKLPQVSDWWKVVESYQAAVPPSLGLAATTDGPPPKITVKVTKQVSDRTYKYGKILTILDFIPSLVRDYTSGDSNIIPVIVTARDVTVEGLCTGKCADHGVKNNKTYIIVGNPETECPAACGWPFHEVNTGPKNGVVLKPPNVNMAADAMVVALAAALADTVTNPLGTGFYDGLEMDPIGPALACKGIFGKDASPGNPGIVQTDLATGVSFNALGNKGKKFLLPAIWDLKTSSCWTL